jgi:uncharacterized protein (DUF433 family)
MAEIIHSINLIVSKPEVRGGRPCIAGTGLRVIDIVMANMFHDRTPDEMAADYGVSLAAVHAALAFYYEHKAELDADIRDQIKTIDEFREKYIAEGNLPLSSRRKRGNTS